MDSLYEKRKKYQLGSPALFLIKRILIYLGMELLFHKAAMNKA